MIIRRQDLKQSRVDANPIFTGEVRTQVLVGDDDAPSQRVTAVTFVDGARNSWHSHSCEQVLIVTDGEGIVATETDERAIGSGDVVLILPGERHWHGAAAGKNLTHLAVLLPSTMAIFEG